MRIMYIMLNSVLIDHGAMSNYILLSLVPNCSPCLSLLAAKTRFGIRCFILSLFIYA